MGSSCLRIFTGLKGSSSSAEESPPASPRAAAGLIVSAQAHDEPLLDLTPKQKTRIVLHAVIRGFGVASSVPGVTETLVNQSISLSAAASLGEWFALGGVGITGALVGAGKAYQQIAAEEEKIIRLNKEIFILLNLAADKYDQWQASGAGTDVTQDAAYMKIIHDIHCALSLEVGSSSLAPTKLDNLPVDLFLLNEIIKQYTQHRKESKELDFWNNNLKNVFNENGRAYIEHFLKFNEVDQATEYFEKEKQRRIKKYNVRVKRLKEFLSQLQSDEKIRSDIDFFKAELDKLLVTAESYGKSVFHRAPHAILSLVSYAMPESKQNAGVLSEFDFNAKVQEISDKFNQIYAAIPADADMLLKNDIWEMWHSKIVPLVNETRNHLKNLPTSIRAIGHNSTIFNPTNGTFRGFCRGLRDKTATRYRGEVAESIPLNLERLLHRDHEKPGLFSMASTSLVTFYGLYSTGNGLYLASAALFATTMSATGVGLIVVGIALALTLLAAYCYYKTTKNKIQRDALLKKSLTPTRRELMLAAPLPDQQQVQAAERRPVRWLSEPVATDASQVEKQAATVAADPSWMQDAQVPTASRSASSSSTSALATNGLMSRSKTVQFHFSEYEQYSDVCQVKATA